MRLKDQLTLPTVNDAIAVRPLSLPVPPGTTERRNLRTERSKTFAHAEKAPDGKEIRTCKAQIGAVCYRDDTGELRSIDTTIRDLGTHVGVEWAPYKFKLHESGIGFDFESREGGQCTVTLTGIGGEKFTDSIKPEVADNTITFRDVRPGCDIVFKCLNERVKTLRILHDENAPRTFDWTVASDKPELIDSTLFGTDAAGNQLELFGTIDGDVFIETWNGITQNDAAVVYPVEIDPDVTATISTGGNDGYSFRNDFQSWISSQTTMIFGALDPNFADFGLRWPINIPQGSTITIATLYMYITIYEYTYGGNGTIYGIASDNAPAFSGTNRPYDGPFTSATATIVAPTATGAVSYTVTGIVQEIISRAGFVQNNNLAIAGLHESSGYHYHRYATYESGANIPYLEITYTTGGGTSNNLLLLGCG